MPQAVPSPGEIDGHGLAVLLLLNFHCRVRLPEAAQEARRALILLLMNLIYQVVPVTSSLQQFLAHVHAALASDPEQAQVVCEYLGRTLGVLEVSDGLTKLFNEKFSRMLAPYDSIGLMETSEVYVDRRSFFGLYFRRMKLVFDSLDLEARGRLRDVALAWREGRLSPSTQFNHTREADDVEGLRVRAYRGYQMAMLTGDYATAKDNMQKSFDYFAPGSDHELHQHTLLHLAAFHYQTGGLSAAKAALEEAIGLARSADDHECIVMCSSLMRRLHGEGSSKGPAQSSDIEEQQLTSQDALWQAEHDIAVGDDLVEVLQRLLRSFQPPSVDPKAPRTSIEMSLHLMEDATRRFGKSAARPDVTVGHLWQQLGQSLIADVYFRCATRGNGASASIQAEGRIKARCERAMKLARKGRYEQALSLLLKPATYKSLSIDEYRAWCETVWAVLWLRAKRRCESKTLQKLAEQNPGSAHELEDVDIEDLVETPKALQELLAASGINKISSAVETKQGPRTPPGPGASLPIRQKIELLLEKAKRLMHGGQPTLALSPALLAIAIAKSRGYAPLERSGIVVLSSITGKGFKMPEQALSTIEEAMPLILAEEDLEARAVAQWTYAECLLAKDTAAKEESTVREALWWLQRAEKDMDAISLIHVQRKVLYYMVRLYHHLDDAERRDHASDKHAEVEKECLRATEAECAESLAMVDRVLEVVSLVGGYVVDGRAAAVRLSRG
ncbi:hypothetical protein ACQY0O_000220 [Thecaphora frezii]